MPYGYVEERKNALCPRCLSLERHRLLWLWLERGTDLSTRSSGGAGIKFLHVAPEVCLSKKFEKLLPPENYFTADLESPLAKVHLDVQNIPFPDASFDIVFCNHVLEHVADDRLAMREMHRVMRPGGWGVMLSPVDETRAATFEDDTVTDPAERTRLFGQYDHRRVYGRDYADRLRETGWEVEEINYFEKLPPVERTRYALRPETLYVVRKRR
jgi:SAM-dependent methyltransferase